jgi:hypothetical protein
MKKHSVDYIRNCVEERTRKLSDRQYSEAYSASYKKECHNMQQRIDAIVREYKYLNYAD